MTGRRDPVPKGAPVPHSADRESRLLQAFLDFADTLVDDYDVPDVLHQLVRHCVDLLGAAEAGLLLSDQRGSLQVAASSSERTRLLELFQVQVNEGPCVDAFRTSDSVCVPDLAAATSRWPHFAAQALAEGFHSVHAVPLRLRGQTLGALNLFRTETGDFKERDLRVARALANAATVGLLHERALRRGEVLTEQLQNALNSRITIEQAKGVLAQAGGVPMDQAFTLLRTHSRRTSIGLSETAHQLVIGAIHPSDVLAHHQRSTR